MSQRSQLHRSTSLPYDYADDGVELELTRVRFDDRETVEIELRPGESTIDLAPDGPLTESVGIESWETATLQGTLEVPERTIASVFPSEEQDDPPARLYVAVRCHETIYRDRRSTEWSGRPETMNVEIDLDWDQTRGSVELRPYVVRTANRDAGDGNYARTQNTKVASGPRYEIVVDHWDDDEPPAIDGERANFAEMSHLPDSNQLYYLDFRDESRPKLWINGKYPRIADVLESEGSVGTEPRLRDVVLDQISYGVWSQLIVRAASAVDDRGDVEFEWQRTVLETFARDLYETDDLETAVQLLRRDLGDADELGPLVGRIDVVLQDFVDPRSQLINLMEEGLRI